MATKHIGSVGVATESTFGSIASATGLPSISGLAYRYLELMDLAQLVTPGEPILTDATDSRTGLYGTAPEPATINGVQRRQGTVTLDTPWRPIGSKTEFSTYADMPLQRILRTALGTYLRTDTAADAVVGTATTTEWRPTTTADFAVGQLLRTVIGGRAEFSAMSSDDGTPDMNNSPAWSTAPTGLSIFPMRVNYLPANGMPSTESVALRLDGDGWRSYCFGCVLTQIAVTMDETSRMVKISMTLDCTHVVDDHAAASIQATDYADGHLCHQMQSYLVIGGTGWTTPGGPSTPAIQTRATLCVDAFTLTIDLTRGPVGCGESIIGRSNTELVNAAVTLEVVAGSTTSSYDDDLWDGRYRNVLLGFTGGDPSDAGEGGCIYLPAAFLNVDASIRDMGKDVTRTRLVWSPGPYGGDDAANCPDDLENSILRLGLA